MKHILRGLVAVALCLALGAQAAVEVADVRFEEQIRLGTNELQLNGAGLRTKVFFKVYAMGLYLPARTGNAAAAIAAPAPRRIHIVTLRDLTAEQFADALVEGIRKNHDDAAYKALKPRVDGFRDALLALRSAPEGTVVDIDQLADGRTRLSVDGKQQGQDIEGSDFYPALLRIWLGDKPADATLKDALLGGK